LSAARFHAPEVLVRIATHLGVPVEAFFAQPSPKVSESIAVLARDPVGQQLATLFVAMTPQHRLSLVNVARALADATGDGR